MKTLIRAAFLTGTALLAACSEPAIKVYDAPKDPPRATVGAAGMATPAGTAAAAHPLRWTLPEGWHAASGSTTGNPAFHAHAGDAVADIVLVEFPADTDETAFSNHLNRQIGREEGPSAFETVRVGDRDARVATFPNPQGASLLAALLPLDGRLWFAQASGSLTELNAIRPSFLAFLASLTPAPAAVATAQPPAVTGAMPAPGAAMAGQTLPEGALARGATPTWTVPSHWSAGTASSMRRGSYRVDGPDGTAIDIAVTAFPGDVGGLLPNLNRWRQQIGLPPLGAAELPGATSRLTAGTTTGTWVDFTGTGDRPQRTLVGFFQVSGETWFFKATGDAALVAREEAAFRAFVESVRFPTP